MGEADEPTAQPLQRVAVRDVTAILRVSVSVSSFQFDTSIMEHPEFAISTRVVFQCAQHGGRALETSWQVFRTFHEFQGLDTQLRGAFPLMMANIRPPRVHLRRAFFRLHKRRSFLARRCDELNAYLAKLLENSSMRLSRFMDPRAPLVLRCFCNFDAGFGRGGVVFQSNPLESCVLCLDHVAEHQPSRASLMMMGDGGEEGQTAFDQVADIDMSVKSQEWELKQQQALRQQWRHERMKSSGSRYDELEANLLDDRARNMAMCLKFECSCQYSSFHVTHNKMTRILQQRGFKQLYRPLEGATALYCVLYQLQQFNDLDKRLYDAMTGIPEKGMDSTHEQLSQGVDILRQALANYGLLHIHALETHFRTSAVELKKKLHEFKSKHHHRVGTIELLLLSTMLDLSITLITNDHEGTEQSIRPLHGLKPIRRGGRIVLTLGYILPTIFNVNGYYLLAEEQLQPSLSSSSLSSQPSGQSSLGPRKRSRPMSFREVQLARLEREGSGEEEQKEEDGDGDKAERGQEERGATGTESDTDPGTTPDAVVDPAVRRRMWLGVEEMDRCLIELIDEQMRSELAWMKPFDHDVAETLNKAILDAVWDDCQHNPNLFHLFQRQARQFGKSRTSASFFFQYLEVAFGMEGAAYLVDFLLYVLPEEDLRKQLLRARWFRLRRHLTKRVSPPMIEENKGDNGEEADEDAAGVAARTQRAHIQREGMVVIHPGALDPKFSNQGLGSDEKTLAFSLSHSICPVGALATDRLPDRVHSHERKPNPMEELKKRHALWCKSLQRAVETDGWGQVIEAVEAYERLAAQLTQELPQFHQLSKDQTVELGRAIEKVAGSLDLRAKCLSSVDGERNSPTKEDMEDILEVLCSVLSDAPQVFPADLGNIGRPAKKVSIVQVVDADAENELDDDLTTASYAAAAQALKYMDDAANIPRAAQVVRAPGGAYLDVKISKIGLKDANVYTNPTIVVSVFDRDGKAMGERIETQIGSCADAQHMSFAGSASVQLEASLKDMEDRGAAIFFEFYHYKPKKRKKSCRCWALLEMDEVAKGGALALELYQKPMDPRRKCINLFTIKELYLHIQLTTQKL